MLRVRQEPAEDANTNHVVSRKGKVMAKKTRFDGIIVKSEVSDEGYLYSHIIRDPRRRNHGNGLQSLIECGQSDKRRVLARRPFDDTLSRTTRLFVSPLYQGRDRFQGRTDQFRRRAAARA
jgi:hypothetical protein